MARLMRSRANYFGGLVLERFDLNTQPLINRLKFYDRPWSTSDVYAVQTKQNVVDTTVRKSQFRHVYFPSFLDSRTAHDSVEMHTHRGAIRFLEMFNESSERYAFNLRPESHATQIRYGQGDFFGAHSDYLPSTSNMFEEFTLIVSLQPETLEPSSIVGGGTRIVSHIGETLTSNATTSYEGGLLFRKDLVHEGLVLERGEKNVILFDVIGKRRPSSRLFSVSFPRQNTSSQSAQNVDILDRLATEGSTSYVIPESCIREYPDSIFHGMLSDPTTKDSNVTNYSCTSCSYDEFETVYRVLMNHRLPPLTLSKLRLLKSFGIGMNIQENDVVDSAASDTSSLQSATAIREKEFLVCNSEEQRDRLLHMAKRINAPVVPFTIVLCEGTEIYDDHGSIEKRKHQLCPVLVSVGEYGNIHLLNARFTFGYCKLFEWNKRISNVEFPPETTQVKIERLSVDTEQESPRTVKVDKETKLCTIEYKSDSDILMPELHLAYLNLAADPLVENIVHDSKYVSDDYAGFTLTFDYLPGSRDFVKPVSKFCHRDSNNVLCFNENGARSMNELINKSKLIDRVKRSVIDGRVKLQFPQHIFQGDVYYCNEVRE